MTGHENLVLIPGLNNSSSVWRPLIDRLPARIDSVAVDLPALTGVDAIADEVAAGAPERFTVVGHSFGGYVAMALLARHPQRLTGIVLVNSSPAADSDAQRKARLDRLGTVSADDYERVAMSVVQTSYHPDNIAPGTDSAERLIAQRREMVREYGFDRFAAHSRAAAARPERTWLLRDTPVPTLIVTADDDRVIATATQHDLARGTGTALRQIGPAGHMLPAEQPAALAETLAAWLAGRDSPAAVH